MSNPYPESVVYSFFVPGVPVPKQSFRYSSHGSHANPRAAAWQQLVSLIAVQHCRVPLAGPLAVTLIYTLPDKRRRDLDNLIKCVLDGLNKIAWNDDSQVVQLHVWKHVGQDAGVQVQVYNSINY